MAKSKKPLSVEDAADARLEASYKFLDAHFVSMALFEKEEQNADAVTAAEMQAAQDLEDDALDDLVAAQLLYQRACRHEAKMEWEAPSDAARQGAFENFKLLRGKVRH